MRIMLVSMALGLLMLVSPVSMAGEGRVSEIAEIVIHLNHYPSAAEKQVLAGMVADEHSTDGEKTIAGALMRMQHRVGGEDENKLRSLVADDAVAQSERELAEILLGIAHRPSDSDLVRLRNLTK